MRIDGEQESSNVDDRRGMSTGKGLAIGGGAVGIIFLIIKLLLGGSPDDSLNQQLNQQLNQPGQTQEMTAEEKAADDEQAHFVKVVLKYTEDVWDDLFAKQGKQYTHPTLVLFRGQV